jgi:hypothetical protein
MPEESEDYPTLTIEEVEGFNEPKFRLTRHVGDYYSDEHLDLGKLPAVKKLSALLNKIVWDQEQRCKPKEDSDRFADLEV